MPDLVTTAANITLALAPAFAAGLAIQHADELADPLISKFSGGSETLKKTLMSRLSLILGIVVTFALNLRIIKVLGGTPGQLNDIVDGILTALTISTGTEGINSIVKFLGYAKDQKKAGAAQAESNTALNLKMVNREP